MYKIEVRKSDIKAKYREQVCECPVAKAFLRAGFEFLDFDHGVDGQYFEGINPEGNRASIRLPKKAIEWIRKFDARDTDLKTLKPITFSVKA